MNSFYYNIGGRIRALCELNRYTREKFAEIADISPKFLYEIETGQKGFSADTLHRIAKGLSVSYEYILSGESPQSADGEIQQSLNLFNEPQKKKLTELLNAIYELSILK